MGSPQLHITQIKRSIKRAFGFYEPQLATQLQNLAIIPYINS